MYRLRSPYQVSGIIFKCLETYIYIYFNASVFAVRLSCFENCYLLHMDDRQLLILVRLDALLFYIFTVLFCRANYTE